jgi:hypothetical protein
VGGKMKQDKTGRHKVVLAIDPLYIRVGVQGAELATDGVFMMEVEFQYEEHIEPCEDDPGADEYCELYSARVFKPLELYGEGVTLLLEPSINILDFISDNQYDQLKDLVLKEKDNERKYY